MTIAEVLLLDFDAEMASTRRLLDRIPEDNPDWKPHEKSMPIGRLAMHVATLPWFGSFVLETPGWNMAEPADKPRPDLTFRTREIMLANFEALKNELRGRLASASDEHLQSVWKFAFGEHVISESSRALTYRNMFFNHLLHHRGQLTVYLRLLNVPVPGLFGPSADEPFGAK